MSVEVTITLPNELYRRAERRAQAEGRDVAEVLATTIANSLQPDIPDEVLLERYSPPPRPASSLTDEDIDVPPDVEDKEAYRQAERALRPKLYRIARRYWAKVGDKERLALTDEELDKQFWLIDHEGIPRLKSEQGTIDLPPDPLDALIGLFSDSDVTNASTTVRETMAKKYGSSD